MQAGKADTYEEQHHGGDLSSSGVVHAVKGREKVMRRPEQLTQCRRCNQRHDYNRCFAYGKTCYKCDGGNHFAICCNQPQKRILHSIIMVAELNAESEEYLVCGISDGKERNGSEEWIVSVVLFHNYTFFHKT